MIANRGTLLNFLSSNASNSQLNYHITNICSFNLIGCCVIIRNNNPVRYLGEQQEW